MFTAKSAFQGSDWLLPMCIGYYLSLFTVNLSLFTWSQSPANLPSTVSLTNLFQLVPITEKIKLLYNLLHYVQYLKILQTTAIWNFLEPFFQAY